MAEIDPTSMATQLANLYVASAQKQLTTQSQKAQSTSTALTKLQSALGAFDTAVSGLTTRSAGVVQRSATLSGAGTAITAASASGAAAAATHQVFVEKVATVHQVAFEDLPAVPVSLGGPLVVQLGDGSSFSVDLTAADQNSDGTISQAEIARAINLAEHNAGKAVASTVTSGGQTHLVLSAGASGADGAIALDASALPDSALKTALGNGRELVAAQDAVVWLGAQGTGIRVQQASNTFTAIEGLTLTLAQPMASGSAPATVAVANDNTATTARLQGFVTAFNALEKALDELTAYGKDGSASAAFASDAGVRNLRNRLNNALRMEVDGVRLADFGIKSSRDGSISLDTAKLDKALAANPDKLDALFGNTGLTTSSGVLGALQSVADSWTDSTTGQIKRRQDSVQVTQKRITQGQDRLELQYENAYQRYLAQFTQLQNLQSQMSETSSLFSALSTTT
ncbi:flagellar filament capping protein FliD [Pseudorhodoferax sp. Leaf274]|uniref:flagellar filament capping protein FliD n=1 Tax=Pseudorhodoferax sp. Leaf274 TaxID=1736318 RepID=UPI000702B285|nr:flagellar filament capping protein FliD [Pseudorhodoferax sp. Leaf274]KQP37179.1 lateral flagellar hook-associated protein 2 [Pseudorhodoferax sp. Leaf274]